MASEPKDTIKVVGQVDASGKVPCVRSRAGGRREDGWVRILEDGKSIMPNLGGSIVHLEPSQGSQDTFDVVSETPLSGPAQVSSQAYRDGWDRVFGRRDVN